MIPHGFSVILNAPAVFRFTAGACPERHLTAAAALGVDTSNAALADAGKILADRIIALMERLKVPSGLKALGYSSSDIPALVEGTLPQHRVTKLSPRPATTDDLAKLFEDTLQVWTSRRPRQPRVSQPAACRRPNVFRRRTDPRAPAPPFRSPPREAGCPELPNPFVLTPRSHTLRPRDPAPPRNPQRAGGLLWAEWRISPDGAPRPPTRACAPSRPGTRRAAPRSASY